MWQLMLAAIVLMAASMFSLACGMHKPAEVLAWLAVYVLISGPLVVR